MYKLSRYSLLHNIGLGNLILVHSLVRNSIRKEEIMIIIY